MTLEPETPTETIGRQQATIRDMYSEIADLTVALGELRKRFGGWGPVISLALERERKGK